MATVHEQQAVRWSWSSRPGPDRRSARDRRRPQSAFQTLTGREQAVLAALVDGLGPARIAERDSVSILTVRSQVKTVLAKLGVRSQLEAVALAHRAGWHPDHGPGRPTGRT